MNIVLKMEILKKFRSQGNAARVFNIREDQLSRIINERKPPKINEKDIICQKLGMKELELFPERTN